MYSKIAVSNVKKSFKDYAIYFLTLTLAVCIFYSFNSIESQKALTDAKFSGSKYVSTLTDAISYISVFISVILGSLILYANNFLIKKRKKELGIYMILGMGKRRISKILVTETLIVGAISLISGLILGIIASQGLAAFALKLFEVPMDKYMFAVSTVSVGKTVLYFGIMFLLVMLFNVFVISKYKIIDLLTAGRKIEEVKFKNPIIYLITFVLCVMSLGYAYKTIIKVGINFKDTMFPVAIVFGIIGTVLFFFSLSGFILYIVKKNKKIYFKELNIFTIKQINSKVNTNFLSISLICLMLFMTISVLCTGISFKQAIEAGLKKATPFDASIISYNSPQNNIGIQDMVNAVNSTLSKNEKYAAYTVYDADTKIGDLIKTKNDYLEEKVSFMKVSDYNKILKLKGEKEISLNNDEVLVSSDVDSVVKIINEELKNSNKFNIKGKEYLVKNHKAIEENIYNSNFQDNILTIIINDNFLSGCKINLSAVNINYLDNNREEYNKKYANIHGYFSKAGYTGEFPVIQLKDEIFLESRGFTTMALFIGIYVGIVFLITSMAVLALQQLSEASDSMDRYEALKKLGANKKMINKTIFTQTLIYFSLPVVLAFLHSVVAIKVTSDFISKIKELDIISSALMTASIFIVVYIGYFYTTYVGYKNIVKSNL